MTAVVILAAGVGARLRPLTDARPKCMVPLNGKTVLDRQLSVLRSVGMDDISIVVGHAPDSIDPKVYPLRVFKNDAYRTTNMVVSLMAGPVT